MTFKPLRILARGVQRSQPLRIKGRFVNPGFAKSATLGGEPFKEPGFREFFEWRKNRPKHPKVIHVPRAQPTPARLPAPPERGIAATWVGHSSVVLQQDGATFLLDPVWSSRIGGVVRRYTQPGVPWSAVPHVDALLISHNHYDHLDAPTVKRLPRDTPVVCPTGLASWFSTRGFTDVAELSWWESTKVGAHRVTMTPAQHFSGRTVWDRDRTLWGGHVVEGPHGAVAYYAGDSGKCAAFREVGQAFPRIDLALIPIGAYEPKWFMASVHVDPAEAGEAFLETGARAMMPVHWGAFRLADEAVDEPPRVLRAWWEKNGLDPSRLVLPPLGEAVVPHHARS